tara:strand:+ start:427 stop:723 length:297 start_codon:yes stop_codon:yes gene_type:complete
MPQRIKLTKKGKGKLLGKLFDDLVDTGTIPVEDVLSVKCTEDAAEIEASFSVAGLVRASMLASFKECLALDFAKFAAITVEDVVATPKPKKQRKPKKG